MCLRLGEHALVLSLGLVPRRGYGALARHLEERPLLRLSRGCLLALLLQQRLHVALRLLEAQQLGLVHARAVLEVLRLPRLALSCLVSRGGGGEGARDGWGRWGRGRGR